jgi:hypothetical protein
MGKNQGCKYRYFYIDIFISIPKISIFLVSLKIYRYILMRYIRYIDISDAKYRYILMRYIRYIGCKISIYFDVIYRYNFIRYIDISHQNSSDTSYIFSTFLIWPSSPHHLFLPPSPLPPPGGSKSWHFSKKNFSPIDWKFFLRLLASLFCPRDRVYTYRCTWGWIVSKIKIFCTYKVWQSCRIPCNKFCKHQYEVVYTHKDVYERDWRLK